VHEEPLFQRLLITLDPNASASPGTAHIVHVRTGIASQPHGILRQVAFFRG